MEAENEVVGSSFGSRRATPPGESPQGGVPAEAGGAETTAAAAGARAGADGNEEVTGKD